MTEMADIASDLLVCMPASIGVLLFLATVGGWGMKKRGNGENEKAR